VLGYHLTNVLLHVVAACLVVWIVRRLSLPGAWFAGFLFALHPVCVEAVAWIAEQKSTLSAVFYLGAAITYLRFGQTRRKTLYMCALGLLVLALLSKTVTATLPAALLLVFWWQRKRVTWKRDVRPLLPWFALGAAAGLFTAWVERRYVAAEGPDFELTLLQRCLLAGRAIFFYLGKLVWPFNLTFTYPRWRLNAAAWRQYAFPLGVLAIASGLWVLSKRQRGPMSRTIFSIWQAWKSSSHSFRPDAGGRADTHERPMGGAVGARLAVGGIGGTHLAAECHVPGFRNALSGDVAA
jgi:hypothetical protein